MSVKRVLIVFIVFLSQLLSGQIHELKFESLNMEDGLNHNSVNCFLHDKNGFLWIGTFEGINVYDGYQMKSFQADPTDSKSLSNNFVECLLEDSRGNIWVGTQNGLNLFVPGKQEFIKYYPDADDSTSISHNVIKTLYQDSGGTLWIGTYGGGLSCYNYDGNSFINYTDKDSKLPCNFINTIFEDRDGVLWFGTWLHGLARFSKEKGIFENYMIDTNPDKSAEKNTINAIMEKRRNVLWLGTWGHGIVEFDTKNHEFRDVLYDSGPDSFIQNSIIKTILPVSSNEVLAGSFGNGLFQVKAVERESEPNMISELLNTPENGSENHIESRSANNLGIFHANEIEQYTYQLCNDHSISNNWIWSLYQDNSGLCWIATWGDGINKIDFYKNRFKTFYSSPVNNNNFYHYQISAVIEISPDVLLIGTIDGGFYQFKRSEKEFVNLDVNGTIEKAKGITTFEKGKGNNIWVGTRDGLFYYNLKLKDLKRFQRDQKGREFSKGEVSAIHSDRLGHLWVGVRGSGIDKLVPVAKNAQDFIIHRYWEDPQDTTSLPSNTVTAVYCDNYDNIWVGTLAGGVSIYDRENDRFQQVPIVDEEDGITLKDVLTIFETNKGEIWIGTLSHGLWHYDRRASKVLKYTKNDGLSNNAVYSIHEDKESNIWLSTGYGISKFNPDTKNFSNYLEKDGLHGSNFNFDIYSAAIKMSDQSMFFGGKNGFTIFSPKDIRRSTYVPEVVINGLIVNGSNMEPGDSVNDRVLMDLPLNKMNEITLTPQEHLVAFEFASLHFATPLNNEYEYTLEGFDKQWFKVDANRRFASYTNLPAGQYTFRVKASNSHGIWHPDSSASLKVNVLPPFWKTPWFILLISVPFILLGYFIYKSRTRYMILEMSFQEKILEAEQIIREKELLTEEQEKLTYELDQKNKVLATNTIVVDQKNQRLKTVKNYLSEITPYVSDQAKKKLDNVRSLMEENSYPMEDWKSFEKSFDVLHDDFLKSFTETFPKITHKDLRLVSYIRMNYSNKEIADMLNISLRSVESSRYRLRKKMDLSSEYNLNDYIIRF